MTNHPTLCEDCWLSHEECICYCHDCESRITSRYTFEISPGDIISNLCESCHQQRVDDKNTCIDCDLVMQEEKAHVVHYSSSPRMVFGPLCRGCWYRRGGDQKLQKARKERLTDPDPIMHEPIGKEDFAIIGTPGPKGSPWEYLLDQIRGHTVKIPPHNEVRSDWIPIQRSKVSEITSLEPEPLCGYEAPRSIS